MLSRGWLLYSVCFTYGCLTLLTVLRFTHSILVCHHSSSGSHLTLGYCITSSASLFFPEAAFISLPATQERVQLPPTQTTDSTVELVPTLLAIPSYHRTSPHSPASHATPGTWYTVPGSPSFPSVSYPMTKTQLELL